jgi:NAD(P)-dependent dehydrogenase (short-subunit alcohol dehydrogenase family)
MIWLITGSSRGLGRSLAEVVLFAGHQVVATARRADQLSSLVERYGEQVRAISLDVTSESQARAAVDGAIHDFGHLDVLVNNAGYGDIAPIEDTPIQDFRDQIETNLFGTIIVTKAALPIFRQQRKGHFIQLSSIGGRIGPAGRGPYAAAKWGVEGFSEVLAREVAPLGIKVTIVEPGGFRTDFAGASTTLKEGQPDYDSTVGAVARFQREYNGKQPGDPDKAAAAILHIAGLTEPPLRLLLGSDAYDGVEKNDLARIEAARQWKELSYSTDFRQNEDQSKLE